jgi:uncharacterized protein (PEP-CTERM system associated)
MILRPTAPRLSRHRVGAVAGCAALSISFVGLTQAQMAPPVGPESLAPEGPRPTVWFEPRVSVGLTLSDNGNLSSGSSRSEQLLEVSPGLRGILNTPRIQGHFDYALRGSTYLQNTTSAKFRHKLDASGTVSVWDNRAFVDLYGSVADEAVSAFGASRARVSRANQSQTGQFRVTPYVRGSLGSVADYELRYSAQVVNSESDARPDLTAQDASARLVGGAGRTLGWTLDAQTQAIDYEVGRDTRSDSVRAGLVYQATPTLSVGGQLGRESNDILTLARESYRTAGLNVQWRPAPRTRLSAGIEERYFGNGHQVSLQHSTPRTIWRYSDRRGVSQNGLQAGAAPLGTLRSLLDSSLQTSITDPIERNAEVDRMLAGFGLPGDIQVFQTYLTSAATLERSQQLSLVVLGARGAATLALTRSDASRLEAPLAGAPVLPDDFDRNARIQRNGWNLGYAHRLTPATSANVSLSGTRSTGTVDTSRNTSFAVGLSSRVAPRTTASVQLSRTRHGGNVRSYHETALAGVITHRF